MAPDSYTEVTHESWFSRLGGAFKGIFFGLLLILGSCVLLFWNEGRAVERHKTLEEGEGAVVSVSVDRVDPAHEGDLVHVTGRAETDETLTDETFGVSAEALRLERQVEMYQWQEEERKETEKKVGGGTRTTTTYSYDKAWSERLIDSDAFQRPGGHENPDVMPWESRQVAADRVTLGDYELPRSLVQKIDRWESLRLDPPEATLPEALPTRASGEPRFHDGGLYFGEGSPSSPEIGDVRVSFRVVKPTEVSIVAQQAGNSFRPFQAEAGGTLELLELGRVTAQDMFAAAQRRNTLLTWGLRLAGLLLMAFGFSLILRPLSVLADVIPLLGSLVGAGLGFVSFLLSAFISLIVIAVAWIFYRPLLGIALLVLAVGFVVWLVRRTQKAPSVQPPKMQSRAPASSSQEGTAPPPPPPPPGGAK